MRKLPAVAAAVLGGTLVLGLASPLAGEDLLVRRSGERAEGRLQSCVGERCQWRGASVARAEIAWIGFGRAEASAQPPVPADPTRDTVWLADGRTIAEPIVGISLGEVAMAGSSFERGAVAWVYFGSEAGAPSLAEAESRAPAPSPPASASRPAAPQSAPAPTSQSPTATPQSAPAPAPQSAAATLLLNEIGFLPAEGETPFVELRNDGPERLLDGAVLVNEKGKRVELPRGTRVGAGALLLIRFGGEGAAAAGTLRLPGGDLLGRERGSLWLSTKDGGADGIAWGGASLSSVELCRGGRCAPPRPGSVIARLPDAVQPLSPAAWAALEPRLATPGAANPRPPVSAIAALPGVLFFGRPRFSWYGVAGAAGYRLEVARDEAFTAIVHRATIAADPAARLEQLAAEGPDLPAGAYFWRVVATSAAGVAAEPSPPIRFQIQALPSRAGSKVGALDPTGARFADGGADGPPAASPAADSVCAHIEEVAHPSVCKELDVPVLDHVKDTRMLTLEAWRENPIGSWDTPDDGPYPYCARAGVQMVHEYYRRRAGGRRLSQDRIGYEVYKDLRSGPEYDLPVVGIIDADTSRHSLPLALGTGGDFHPKPYASAPGQTGYSDRRACMDYQTAQAMKGCEAAGWAPRSAECIRYLIEHEDDFPCPPEIAYAWGYTSLAEIRAEIDAGRPVIATNPGHLFLWVGYAQVGEDEYLIYQDAGGRQPVLMGEGGPDRAANAFVQNVDSFWTGLAAVALGGDEEEIASDGDGDGLVDFDETRRFGTNASDRDSDDDGVDDKQEIRYSVWDSDRGYHRRVQPLPSTASSLAVEQAAGAADLSGRDPDGDGKAMELDPDSDAGGCDDGEENANGDGRRDRGETSNFERTDDPTVEPGECGELWTGTSRTRFSTHQTEGFTEITVDADLRFREKRRDPIIAAAPGPAGGEAGVRIGSISSFTCAGTTLRVTWRQRYWSGSTWTCNCSGDGETTMGEAPHLLDGFIVRKSVDWSLQPLLGYDVSRDRPLYAIACSPRPDETFTVDCSCTDSGSHSGTSQFPYPAGAGLGNPLTTVRCNHDPEVRELEGGGTQMRGSYRIHDPSCAPDTAVSTWSLCKAGTPCAPLPPLPDDSP
jgi:hypothetical protein